MTKIDNKRYNAALFKELSGISDSDEPKDELYMAVEALARIGEPDPFQEAIDAINAYTRAKIKEDGFMRKIMPPLVYP